MLREILNKSYYLFEDGFDDWRDAIKRSYAPLLKDRIINDKYLDSVISCVEEYGPYIVIVKGVAMPHSTADIEGCNESAVSFMRVKQPVKFDLNDREKDATLFFSLAVSNHDEHVKNMQQLMEVLMNEDLLSELFSAEDEKMFREIVNKYE